MSQPTSTPYDTRYPSIADLKQRAKRRIPKFAFDYVDGAIDDELAKRRNREAFHNVHLTPRYLRDVSNVDTRNTLFGTEYALPFGISPIGLGNMMWPGAERALARAAQAARIPYVLSTFSTTDLDIIAEEARDVCWFQLYVPRNEDVMEDLIARVKRAGFHALVVTVDIPVGAKRNRELKNGLKLPFTLTPQMIWESLTHPTWALTTLAHGAPDFVNVARYRTD
ncbi:MAG: alpha-hydroxy acid oxidase, partial [Pseudomonadota bacterium]